MDEQRNDVPVAPDGDEDTTILPRRAGPIAGMAGADEGGAATREMAPYAAGGFPAEVAPYGGHLAATAPGPYGAYAPFHGVSQPDMQDDDTLRSTLREPLPLWATAVVAGAAVAVPGLLFLFASRQDLAYGAQAAGIACLLLGIIFLIGLAVRVSFGRRAVSALVLGSVLVVALFGAGIGGLASASPLHLRQGQAFEQQKRWADAIAQYEQYGEDKPSAPNIARAYTLWGEELLASKQYAAAIDRLEHATTDYPKSGAIIARANRDIYTAFGAWVKSGKADFPFGNAITFMSTYRKDPGCDAACKKDLDDIEPQTRLQYAQQLLQGKLYTDAIAQYEGVTASFGNSQYAGQAHGGAATAYLALGQLQRSGAVCSDAVPTYQKLADKYGDTPEGQKAKDELAAPQPVTGSLQGYPDNPLPRMHLSKKANTDQNDPSISDDYGVGIDGASGAFSFDAVDQGDYNLSSTRKLTDKILYVFYNNKADGNVYAIHVGPLCPTVLGALPYGR